MHYTNSLSYVHGLWILLWYHGKWSTNYTWFWTEKLLCSWQLPSAMQPVFCKPLARFRQYTSRFFSSTVWSWRYGFYHDMKILCRIMAIILTEEEGINQVCQHSLNGAHMQICTTEVERIYFHETVQMDPYCPWDSLPAKIMNN